jgi:hypothetical protein
MRTFLPYEAEYHYPDEFPPAFRGLIETWKEWAETWESASWGKRRK